jgi:hypothetical protein
VAGDLSWLFGLGMLLVQQKKNAHDAACSIFAWMTGKPQEPTIHAARQAE